MLSLQHSYNTAYCNYDEVTHSVLFEIGIHDRDGNECGRNVKNKKPHIIMPSDCIPIDKTYWKRAPAFMSVNVITGDATWFRNYSDVVSVGYSEHCDENGRPVYERTLHIASEMPIPKIDIPKDPDMGVFRKSKSAAELFADDYVEPQSTRKIKPRKGKSAAEIMGVKDVV
jgi:hypothetical protein